MTPEVSANYHQPRLLSAFFGLDNSLPFRANLLCLAASSTDGMPVIFSRTLDPESLQAEDFSVITRSGARKTPLYATLRPALDTGETRAVCSLVILVMQITIHLRLSRLWMICFQMVQRKAWSTLLVRKYAGHRLLTVRLSYWPRLSPKGSGHKRE